MGGYHTQPDLMDQIKDLKTRVQALANTQNVLVCTTATRPASSKVTQGTIIYVTDGGAGAVFQGWNGSAWVNLG